MSTNQESQFEIGAVVRLKSGGIKMTVTYHNGDGKVTCEWFESSNMGDGERLANSCFPEAALTQVPNK